MVNHIHKEKTPTLKAPQNKQNLSEDLLNLFKQINQIPRYLWKGQIYSLLNAYGQDLVYEDKHTMRLQYHCQLKVLNVQQNNINNNVE